MVSVPVYNETGEQVGTEELDEAVLGGEINPQLLKQAVVMYHANQRQGHAVTRGRSEVQGSSRKLYRQKGTGRARMGNARTPIRRGGGHAFAKKVREFRLAMPTKMRRLARNQAILAKIQAEEALIVDGVKFDTPKTARFATLLQKVKSDNNCVFATCGFDDVLYKSGRNIPRLKIMNVADLNASDVLSRRKLIFTRAAFDAFKQAAGGAVKVGE